MFLVGLTEAYSNNKIIIEFVKNVSRPGYISTGNKLEASVSKDESIITEITQQQKRDLTDEEIAEIITLYKEGKSTYYLSDKFGCHRSTISRLLKNHNVEVSIEKINMEEAIKMYNSGATAKEIAEKYHMTEGAVSHRLKKAGVKMRSKWDYNKE